MTLTEHGDGDDHPSADEIRDALMSDAFPEVNRTTVARTDPEVLEAAARFGSRWTPTPPEFRVKHDEGPCTQEIVWGFIRSDGDDEEDDEYLEFECDGCGGTWRTTLI